MDDYFFVFYKPGEQKNKIKFPVLPKGWYSAGQGGWDRDGMTREEQFMGPKQTYKTTRKRVEAYFKKLKRNGSVLKFKILKRIRS